MAKMIHPNLIRCYIAITKGNTSAIFQVIVVALLLIINLGYGGGFSTLPALLSERFGMKKISQIHGLALSAWAIAGLTGNNTTELTLNLGWNYPMVILLSGGLYIIAFVICCMVGKKTAEA